MFSATSLRPTASPPLTPRTSEATGDLLDGLSDAMSHLVGKLVTDRFSHLDDMFSKAEDRLARSEKIFEQAQSALAKHNKHEKRVIRGHQVMLDTMDWQLERKMSRGAFTSALWQTECKIKEMEQDASRDEIDRIMAGLQSMLKVRRRV